MNSLLPPDDREFILTTIKESEDRGARRLSVVLDKITLLDNRIETAENYIIKNGSIKTRNVVISTTTIVSVITSVISYFMDKW